MTSGVGNWRGWAAKPLIRLVAFAAALAVLAGAAALIGRASGLDVEESADHESSERMAHGGEAPPGTGGNGLSDAAAGLRLRLEPGTLETGVRSRLRLSIVDRDGEPIAALHGAHGEPPLHLILVRRDLAGYRHLHPKRSGQGYVVDLALPLPGIWRAYADFEVDGEKIVLGRDLFVPGDFTPQPLPAIADAARSGSYDVELGRQELRAGAETTLRFRIRRAGETVDALEPYLGADGHLVAIRERDLAYLHVHPLESSAVGRIDFGADFADPGRYAFFLQFKHEGRVQTARFTVEVAR
ncbi:MAG: hypothetical protein MSC30_10490 [Gaiellaceae bacterium MAG52_C11]|nr:hypothetical protein [Candidatus Gaiellasilicea maunaloa]